jgi:putative restriction endonuclease
MVDQVSLIYLHGVAPGWYIPRWPLFVIGDDPTQLTFTVAVDDPAVLRPDLPPEVVDDVRRSYATRLARQRLHQSAFRHRVLAAHRTSCTICSLRHAELLDAAHIVRDSHPLGLPVTSNGLSLCKLHHGAFDAGTIGIRPDLVVEVRQDILDEIDAPMLRHGLQEMEGRRLSVVPSHTVDRPATDLLELRYDLFRNRRPA